MLMDDREKALENKFAYDQHRLFLIEARASKLLGHWAAAQLGLAHEAADMYSSQIVATNIDHAGYAGITQKLLKDFQENGLDISEHMIEQIIRKKKSEAAIQIENEARH